MCLGLHMRYHESILVKHKFVDFVKAGRDPRQLTGEISPEATQQELQAVPTSAVTLITLITLITLMTRLHVDDL